MWKILNRTLLILGIAGAVINFRYQAIDEFLVYKNNPGAQWVAEHVTLFFGFWILVDLYSPSTNSFIIPKNFRLWMTGISLFFIGFAFF